MQDNELIAVSWLHEIQGQVVGHDVLQIFDGCHEDAGPPQNGALGFDDDVGQVELTRRKQR